MGLTKRIIILICCDCHLPRLTTQQRQRILVTSEMNEVSVKDAFQFWHGSDSGGGEVDYKSLL